MVQPKIMERQLAGYRLATAEIIYRMPDHLELLQSYVWQDYDLAPEFPELRRFLRFWTKNLDGPLYSVTVGSRELMRRGEWRNAEAILTLHYAVGCKLQSFPFRGFMQRR